MHNIHIHTIAIITHYIVVSDSALFGYTLCVCLLSKRVLTHLSYIHKYMHLFSVTVSVTHVLWSISLITTTTLFTQVDTCQGHK